MLPVLAHFYAFSLKILHVQCSYASVALPPVSPAFLLSLDLTLGGLDDPPVQRRHPVLRLASLPPCRGPRCAARYAAERTWGQSSPLSLQRAALQGARSTGLARPARGWDQGDNVPGGLSPRRSAR